MKNKVVSEEYSTAVAEVLSVLEYFPEELKNQIPEQMMDFFKQVSKPNDSSIFDVSKGIENLDLTDKARALLAMLYRNYFCSEEERQEFDQKLYENEENFQKQLREKYNPDNIFKNPKPEENQKEENNQMTSLIEYKEEKWYQKIVKRILEFLKK